MVHWYTGMVLVNWYGTLVHWYGTGKLVCYTGTLVSYTGTLVWYTGTLVSFTGTLVSYTGTLVWYTGTLVRGRLHTGAWKSDLASAGYTPGGKLQTHQLWARNNGEIKSVLLSPHQ